MSKQRRRNGLGTALSIGALAGLLIWTKLRLVSDLPRSAYAVPQEVARGEEAPGVSQTEGMDESPETGSSAGRVREGEGSFSD